MESKLLKFNLILFLVFFVSCDNKVIPEKATVVENFEIKSYLGTWYEIARFDLYFEKDLDNTSAHYSLNEDGTIQVVNIGFNQKTKKWKKIDGKARFRNNEDQGALEVSFFGPFYSGYNIVALDKDYKYALVVGKDLNYLWMLSREKFIPDNIKLDFVNKAQQIGYNTSRLIWVKHDKLHNPYF
ncbi:lipocalin family protein [Myroides albus]|uniref:Outer membrane lipoprotein Blc n=1 Tax=Myroides albus TaxID=2562892 RepID=A0A6I3LRV5_9FLAO|nr:lipocalin family protein [Myroides albus]MTG99431.1 hypothetical protein [Myroides albus]UVD79867.1 lipocalin family protein [Myroides albus]